LDVGDARLACTDAGSGTPVVWLHGSGPGATGMSNFGGNLPAFEGFRNIVVALPGGQVGARGTEGCGGRAPNVLSIFMY
jgi:pimeloyl-ACP methyl ester carboxylesterase